MSSHGAAFAEIHAALSEYRPKSEYPEARFHLRTGEKKKNGVNGLGNWIMVVDHAIVEYNPKVISEEEVIDISQQVLDSLGPGNTVRSVITEATLPSKYTKKKDIDAMANTVNASILNVLSLNRFDDPDLNFVMEDLLANEEFAEDLLRHLKQAVRNVK